MESQNYLTKDLLSTDWHNSRKEAIEMAQRATNSECSCDFPTSDLVTIALTNNARGNILMNYCHKTRFIPWFIAKKRLPDLNIAPVRER